METADQPVWKGYAFMVMFVVCLTSEFFIDNYTHQICGSISLKLRTTLSSAIFRKVWQYFRFSLAYIYLSMQHDFKTTDDYTCDLNIIRRLC